MTTSDTHANETHANETHANETHPNETSTDETRPDETRPDETRPNETSVVGGEYDRPDIEFDRDRPAGTTGTTDTTGAVDTTGFSPYDGNDVDSAPVLLPVDPPADTDERSFVDDRSDVLPDEDTPLSTDGSDDVLVKDEAADGLPADDTTGDELPADGVLPTPAPPATSEPATSEPATSEPATSEAAASEPAGSTSATADWHELQSKFVDDPAAAVRDAGALVEKALTDLRGHLEADVDTEGLRTAFRRYRDLFSSLN